MLIKDNIDTADRMMTTAGSLALEGSIAAADAFVVERLRAAGAVILGKTNLSEWANFRSTKSTSGWSGRGGQTRNPYVLDRNPCGSSSGTGAAIAANLAAVGVGTETDGSIVCPSSVERPGRHQADGRPGEPLGHHPDLAHAGHGRPDGPDGRRRGGRCSRRWPASIRATRRPRRQPARRVDYAKALDAGALKGARIGVARKRYFGYSPAADRVIDAAIAEMKASGAVIVDPADIPTAATLDDCEFEILLYEFKADLNAYLAGLGPSAKVQLARGSHRVQRAREGARDAVLRPGAVRAWRRRRGR